MMTALPCWNGMAICAAVLLFVSGCAKEESMIIPSLPSTTDSDLYLLAKNTPVKTFYGFSNDTLLKGGNSAHSEPKLRTWYNAKAATQLDAHGRVKTTAVFPDSSLIVKEIYSNNGSLVMYAIVFKLSTSADKGPGDWVWSELEANGNPLIPASAKGAGCAGCHSSGIVYTRMNDAHP